MSIERRRFIRFDVPLEVLFKSSDDSSLLFSGITKNFSRYGCCVEVKSSDLSLEETMELQLRHPRKDTFVSASGKVVWKQQLDHDIYQVGINLLAMDREAKSEILDFAYDVWLENNIKFPV